MSQMLPRISSQRRKRTRYLLLMLFGVLFVHISLNVVSFLGAGWTKRSNSESCGTGIDDLPTNVRRISQKVNGSLEILLNLDVNMQQDSLSGDAAMIDQVIHFLQDKLKDLNIHLNTTKLKDLDGDQHKDTKTKGYQEGSMDSAQILHNATTPAYITHNTTGEFTPHAPPMNTTFVLNSPDLCRNSPDLEYIIYVHTAPANSDRRKVMRSTWASPSLFKRNITKYDLIFTIPRTTVTKAQNLPMFKVPLLLIRIGFSPGYSSPIYSVTGFAIPITWGSSSPFWQCEYIFTCHC